MGKTEKIIMESSKVKAVYVLGVFVFFALTIAVLLSKDILFHHLFSSPTVILIATVVSWILAGCFTIAAFICACSGRGYYALTKQRITYKGSKGKVRWEINIRDIIDCKVTSSQLLPICNCCKLALIMKEPFEGRSQFDIGPFPRSKAKIWETEVKKRIDKVK